MKKNIIISQIISTTIISIGYLLGFIAMSLIDIYLLYVSLSLFCIGILKTISYIDKLKNK